MSYEGQEPRRTVKFGDAFPAPGKIAWVVTQKLGWRVVPGNWVEKRPIIKDWPNVATTDRDVLDMWWGSLYITACVCVVTGRESGIWVLDVDARSGGYESLERLEADIGPLPDTFRVETPSGGEHLYFEYPADGEVVTRPNALGPGLDTRGWHGQVLAPMTMGLYVPKTPVTIAETPPGLLDRVRRSRAEARVHVGTSDREPLDADTWVRDAANVGDGAQEDYLFRGLCSLWARNTDPAVLRDVGYQVIGRFEQTKKEPWERHHVDYKVEKITERYEPGPSDVTSDPELVAWARGELVDGDAPDAVEAEIAKRLTWHRADREARRILDAEEAAAARGPRPKRTAREYADVPQPAAVIDQVLAAEVNLLGGPSEAGKSLLARDWALCVATGGPWRGYLPIEIRNVLFVASEGLHDFTTRWTKHPLWERAADRVFILDEPVDMVRGDDVDWLLDEYAEERPGLVVFDVIYGMGMPDDNGTKDVGPVIKALKRVSAAFGGATLALGHPGHNGERRFRGSSMWRQLAAVEWHMADGSLSCQKSKIADKHKLAATYVPDYPELRWRSSREAVASAATQREWIAEDIARTPDESNQGRAERLAPALGLSVERVRKLVAEVKKDQ